MQSSRHHACALFIRKQTPCQNAELKNNGRKVKVRPEKRCLKTEHYFDENIKKDCTAIAEMSD
jgi:hypothetical protein